MSRKEQSKDSLRRDKVKDFWKNPFRSISKDERRVARASDDDGSATSSADGSSAETNELKSKQLRLKRLREMGLWPIDKDPLARPDPIYKTLEGLWESYKSALATTSSDSGHILRDFVGTFNPNYTRWNDEFELDAATRPDAIRKSFYIPYLDKNTAKMVVRVFCKYTSDLADAISQEKTFHSAEGLEYIYVLNVLTRLEYNGERVLESGLEVLQNLMRVIKVVLVSIREPFARDLKALDEPCEIKEMLIQLVVINCFSIILNLATASLNWRERPEDSPQSRVQYDIASAKLVEIKREFLRLGILPILKGYFDHLTQAMRDTGSLTGSQEDLQLMLLNVLGAMLYKFPPAKERMGESYVLDAILPWLRWPSHIICSDPDISPATKPAIRDEFRVQLLCLQCIREAVDGPNMAQRISSLGGWERLIDVIFWTTEVFSINPVLMRSKFFDTEPTVPSASDSQYRWSIASLGGGRSDAIGFMPDDSLGYMTCQLVERPSSPLPPAEQFIRLPTREVSSILYTLVELCKSSDLHANSSGTAHTTSSSSSSSLSTSTSTSSSSSPNLSASPPPFYSSSSSFSLPSTPAIEDPTAGLTKVNRVIVNILLDLFNVDIRQTANNTRVRNKLKSEYPELQYLVIQVLSELIMNNEQTVALCRRYRLWDVLFSEFFFYCGQDSTLQLSPKLRLKDERRDFLFSKMQTQVLRFLEFVATVPNQENIEECQKILELLDLYHDNPFVVLLLGETLLRILQHNRLQTQRSLYRLNALSVIVMIIKTHQAMSTSLVCSPPVNVRSSSSIVAGAVVPAGVSPSTHQARVAEETFVRARHVVLSLLMHALHNNEALMRAAIRDHRTTSVLLSLTFEPEYSKYALQQIILLLAIKTHENKAQLGAAANISCNDETLKLYTDFFALFRRAQVGSLPMHFELLLQLLASIRTVISKNPKTQRIFKEAGAFLNLTTLLNVEARVDRIPVLCREVLKTLTALMAGNNKNKTFMRTNIGYDQLKNLIVNALRHDKMGSFANECSFLLFDMLVDGDFDLHANYTIQNADVVTLLFNLIPHMQLSKQLQFMDNFTKLVEKSPLNQSLCCHKSVIFDILQLIPSVQHNDTFLGKLIVLIEVLGTHNITVKELKRLFLLLKSEPGDFRPIAQTRLMKALQFMALSRSEGPPVFFDFDGKDSGLVLPTLEKILPQHHGYSFCCWLRAESFSDPLGSPNFQPRIFSFLDKEGFGIELYFAPKLMGNKQLHHVLALYIASPGGKKSSLMLEEYSFEPRRWYYIVVTHNSQSRVLWHQSEVRLYVDGAMVQKVPHKYPQLLQPLNCVRIGTNCKITSSTLQLYRESPFYGQMGDIYFLDDVLTANQVKQLHSLGPSYDISEQIEASRVDTKRNELVDLPSKIFLHFNCRARVGKFYLDITPETNRDRRLDAKVLGNLNACSTRDVKDIIHCLGGIKVLFPLFAQLNQPLVPRSNDDAIDYSVDSKLLLQVLALLGDMLNKSDTNQEEMLRCSGFAVVGYLVQRASPQHLTSDTLVTIEDLGNKIQIPELLEKFYTDFLFNWHLWIYSNASVQWELTVLLCTLTKNNPQYFRDLFGVQKLLDVLFFWYWYEPRAKGVRGTEVQYHPVTKECIGRRPNSDELKRLRRSISLAIVSMVEGGIRADEVQAILCYFSENRDAPQVAELLELILQLIDLRVPGLSELLEVEIFLTMLRNDNEAIRILALQVVAMILVVYKKEKRGKMPEIFKTAATLLQTYPFREDTYRALFSILIGRFRLEEARASSSQIIDESMVIAVPGALPAIFKLLLVGKPQLRQMALQDLYLLLSNSYENRDTVLKIFGWQDSLFAILADKPSDAEDEQIGKVVYEMVNNIFKLLLLHSLKVDKSGWRVLEQTVAFLFRFDARGVLEREQLLRTLFTKMLSTIGAEAKSDRRETAFILTKDVDYKNSPSVNNLVYLVFLVEEFLYYTPSAADLELLQQGSTIDPSCIASMGHHVTEGGEWSDYDLARMLLDTLDILQVFTPSGLQLLELMTYKNPQMRPGGVQRVAIRVATDLIHSGTVKICVETVPRIRAIVDRELSHNRSGEVSPVVTYLLATLLRTLKSALLAGAGGTEDPELHSKAKAIVPLMKDLLRACIPILPPAAKESLSNQSLQFFTESGTAKQFISSFSSPQWGATLAWADQMAALGQSDEKDLCAVIEKQRIKASQLIEEQLARDDLSEMAEERRLQEEVNAVMQRYVYPELERREAVIVRYERARNTTARQWRRILRSLTNERAPWGNKETELHWKLDKTENLFRMRLKLKRNYNFDPHAGAARSVEDQPSGAQEEQQQQQVQESLKLFSGVKLSAMEDVEEALASEENTAAEEVPMSEKNSENEATLPQERQEKLVYTTTADLVAPMNVTAGVFEVTTTHIYFHESVVSDGGGSGGSSSSSSPNLQQDAGKAPKELKIPLDKLREVHLRRYLLRRSALEIFLVDRTNYFLNFKKRDRNKVYNKIINLAPPNLTYFESGSPEQILKRSDLTRRWQQRQISNFEYLMQLNTIAGRTYNDLTQYPVFPWVLSNYTSPQLDLNDPANYRDLSKPVGALNPSRLEMFLTRYENFCDPDIPKFLYGSHYSSSAIVLFYLIRVEPFTTYFLQLQGGKFDHADRMFDSIPQTWFNCYNASSDVKELIPEFFYFPDFLVNANGFNLGSKQNGRQMGEVVLPAWASSPEEFIRIHAAALESEYVSQNLHHWIDLVFGFKQRGRNAIEAYNVFYYLTYEGAVDIDAIEDDDQRRATESQIDNFGQTPAQLMRRPHPSRQLLDIVQLPMLKKLGKDLYGTKHPFNVSRDPIVFLCMVGALYPDAGVVQPSATLISVDSSRLAASHRFLSNTPSPTAPFSFELDAMLPTRRRVGVPFSAEIDASSSCFAISTDGKAIFSCGHWDNTFKCTWLDNSRPVQSIRKHKDLVTCLAITADGKVLVTGSKDTTLLVWEVVCIKGITYRMEENPMHILYGHNDDVTCVAVDHALDICVSGSKDGTCIVHNLSDGVYVRSIDHPSEYGISLVHLSSMGHIVMYSQDDLVLHVFNINGKLLASTGAHERVSCLYISKSAEFLVCGNLDGTIVVRTLFDLKMVYKLNIESKILSLTMSSDEKTLHIGSEDGRVTVLTIE